MRDIEAKIYLHLNGLKEETNKVYDEQNMGFNKAYIFNDYKEYNEYFSEYLSPEVNDLKKLEILNLSRMYVTRKGSIIAMKHVCDRFITVENNNVHRSRLKIL